MLHLKLSRLMVQPKMDQLDWFLRACITYYHSYTERNLLIVEKIPQTVKWIRCVLLMVQWLQLKFIFMIVYI